jgi:hypothetical protein
VFYGNSFRVAIRRRAKFLNSGSNHPFFLATLFHSESKTRCEYAGTGRHRLPVIGTQTSSRAGLRFEEGFVAHDAHLFIPRFAAGHG